MESCSIVNEQLIFINNVFFLCPRVFYCFCFCFFVFLFFVLGWLVGWLVLSIGSFVCGFGWFVGLVEWFGQLIGCLLAWSEG